MSTDLDAGTDRTSDEAAKATRCRRGTDRVSADERARRWRERGWTTIVLEERADGRWRATQRGVAIEGEGETAADAAADYCAAVADE